MRRARRGSIVRAIGAVALSAVALGVAVRSADLDGVRGALAKARYSWLIAYPVLCIALNLLRGEMWRLLLRRRVRTLDAFWAYSIGFVANNLLPFRIGEGARVVALSTRTGVPIVEAGAAAALERLLDLVMLALMLALLAPVVAHVPGVAGGAVLVGSVVGVAVVTIVCAVRYRQALASVLSRAIAWLPHSARDVLDARGRELVRGASGLADPSIAVPALGCSAVVWVLTVVLQWLVLRAFQPGAGATDAAFMVAAVSLASALPSAPGFVGVYHWAGQLSLMAAFPARYDANTALAAATVAHAASYVTSTAIGLIGLWHFRMTPFTASRPAAARDAAPRVTGAPIDSTKAAI